MQGTARGLSLPNCELLGFDLTHTSSKFAGQGFFRWILSELPLQILRFEQLFATDRRGICRFLELALILFYWGRAL